VYVKRHAQATARAVNEVSLVGFRVGRGMFAVQVQSVREIIAPVPLVQVPDASRIVLGVIEHRGEVVPIVDLRRRFAMDETDPARRIKWIIVDVGSGRLGLVVDDVTEVFRVDASQERPTPRVGPGEVAHGFSRVYAHEGALVMTLDLKALARAIEEDSVSALPALGPVSGVVRS
jgi:purine-binding chemotaxis protein CheW